jgi:hypothetical protein
MRIGSVGGKGEGDEGIFCFGGCMLESRRARFLDRYFAWYLDINESSPCGLCVLGKSYGRTVVLDTCNSEGIYHM